MARKLIVHPGTKFGRLSVVKETEHISYKRGTHRRFICVCECGNHTIANLWHLIKGRTRSCGCLSIKETRVRNTTHGLSMSRIYGTWLGMRRRCSDESDKEYKNYGGRGIAVCNEWNSFETFFDWAMSSGYRYPLQIDRRNNDGDYCPENCKWSTSKEQCRNKRTNHLLSHDGKTLPICVWAEEVGLPASVIVQRVNRYHWSTERALTTPKRQW